MDQGPIAALKKRYMTNFILHVMGRDEHKDAITKIKSWNIKDAITLIGSCWSQITEKTLANAWKNLLKKHKEVREIEILEDELIGEELARGVTPAAADPDIDNDIMEDFEGEIELWQEVNELVEVYHTPTVEDIVTSLANEADLIPSDNDASEAEDNHKSTVVEVELHSADPIPSRISDIALVNELQQLLDQLHLRSWTTAEDTQSTQTILSRAKQHIYCSNKKQTKVTDYMRNRRTDERD